MLYALLLGAMLQAASLAQDWQADGVKALEERRYLDAAGIFSKAVAADGKDYSAHFHLALAYSMLNRDPDAIGEYQQVLSLKPGLYEAELNLGILYLRQKEAARALPLLQHAAAAKPAEFRPRYYAAEALLASGKFQEAAGAFLKSLAIDPKSAAAESGLARSLAADHRVDDAAVHFRKAAELDPTYRDSLLELANAFEREKRPNEAVEIYKLFPENPAAQERTGQILLDAGQAAQALPFLETSVKRSPTPANRMALVSAYLATKQSDKAFALLPEALQSDPRNFELRMLAGRMLRDQRKFPEATSQFFFATQLKPDSTEAWGELAGACIMAEKYPEALASLDKIKSLGAEKPGHFYFRAIVLDKLHQQKPAVDNYKQFLELSNGQRPDEEFKARQRVRILEKELSKK